MFRFLISITIEIVSKNLYQYSIQMMKSITKKLVRYLTIHTSEDILQNVFRALNSIVSRDASRAQCERIINGMHLLTLLTDGDVGTQQLACGLIYKMVASDDKLIQVLIDANYTAQLIEAVTTLQSYKLDNRAAAVAHSMIKHGTSEQVSILVSQGCLQPFCDLLAKDNKRIIRAALSVISNICLVLSSFWDR